jgi:hypothetical protein
MHRSDVVGLRRRRLAPRAVIRANHVHDGPEAKGIYLDDGSGAIEVTQNLVHEVGEPMFLNNYYLGRNETCSVHDNYFGQDPALDESTAQIAREAGIQGEYQDILAK